MRDYTSEEVQEDLRQFFLMIGKRFDAKKGYLKHEELFKKLAMGEVWLCLVKLSRHEDDEWAMALARKEPEFATEQGWTLSGDIPKLLKPYLGPTVDYDAFSDFWKRCIPRYSVIDIDRPFNPSGEGSGKTWVEHFVAVLHYCPLFYVSKS
jgi:hypothetical protein